MDKGQETKNLFLDSLIFWCPNSVHEWSKMSQNRMIESKSETINYLKYLEDLDLFSTVCEHGLIRFRKPLLYPLSYGGLYIIQ